MLLRRSLLARCAVLACGALPLAAAAQSAKPAALPAKFDPARDAAADVRTAIELARKQNKRVLVDVGGEWCIWCHILDRFVASHPDVKKLVDDHYVWLKVNWSPQNRNEAVLAQWPKIKGYPHLLVLDAQGKLLHSQDTSELEAGKDYDEGKVIAFLRQHRRA
jgi:thiol:disulfide interchange protein